MEKNSVKISLKAAIIISIVVIITICAILGTILVAKNKKNPEDVKISKIDDWQYDETKASESTSNGLLKGSSLGGITAAIDGGTSGASSFAPSSLSNDTLGFSTGGAKNINNFRENIKNGYFPILTDITYNGLFYDYSFDTGRKSESTELFSPSYSTAVSKDPISGKNETYMTVGLNSNIKQSDFARKKLNLVVVLDISGSMSSTFSSYYYDRFFTDKEKKEIESDSDNKKTKMQIANESVNILLDQLKDDDRFGMVLFDDTSYIGKEISSIAETNVDALKNHILEIKARGGTNFEAGYTKGTDLFKEYMNVNSDEYENRIIVITDAMPNYGSTSKDGLLSYVKQNSEKGIYTSFIGVGVDFNTELIEAISDVKGANYYSVHSSKEFKDRMGEEFEYMVTPLVFDLQLNLKSDDYEIEKVYGSDTVNKENGNIMHVNTLFPSKTKSNGEVKGGIILLKLKPKNEKTNGTANISVSYKDRNGKEYSNSQIVNLDSKTEHFDNTGIRKGIVLTRYANMLKNWIMYERTQEKKYIIVPAYGIVDCDYSEKEIVEILGEYERTSVKITVSSEYKELFNKMKDYIASENNFIKDEALKTEINVLNTLTSDLY